ncbi:HK97 family phage prohead protease [Sphingomonas koreensis]|nr:HK97 family phage prohead protease [Sphingomonas koreensis]RSU32315.1 HK97 family phage prohead protease [Sphingomonas koreensis]RSU35772.1 HK97 family phage prohead protease [Sphingomonas koreensis]RSU49944.1 HK97 family phage prohead protease [Sphingomonas koreensis]RSU83519.1 HK97 family phage prohead protease [Sphingomonas koreensis]
MHYKHGQLKVRDFAFDVKEVKEDGSFDGYGSVFGVVDSYQEVVAKGAFTESLKEIAAKGRPVPLLWQHRSGEPIGAWTKLVEDEHGLFGEGQILLDAGAMEQRAYAHMKARTVSGLSIGYWVRESSYDEKTGIRTLTKLDLVEVSLVTFPANDDARVEAVKFKLERGQLPTKPEFEKALREAFPFSKTQAAAIASHGLDYLLRSESVGAGDLKSISEALAGFDLPTL